MVLNGITGAAGLLPTLAALEAGNTLALANKESLIIGGPLVTSRAKPGQIVPVDSEHSALAQCLRGGRSDEVRRLVLTASGGPFRGRSREDLHDVTVQQALAHPTWSMGPVVTINSATLVNKGLEVIEAHLLFDIPFAAIEVVVHPTSVVHSMVEFHDGSTLVQASPPTMAIPIALGLAWPDRVPGAAPPVDWTRPETWEFFPLDNDAFPAVRLAREAGERAGTAPAVYNAANEVCVRAFVDGEIRFTDIVPTVQRVLAAHDVPSEETELTVEDVLAADEWAREQVRHHIQSHERPRTPPHDGADVHARRAAVRRRHRRVHRPARARSPGAGEEVRREGDAVLHRVRPHALVQAQGRDRVRRQGDPARWLRQARRDAPTGTGRGPDQLRKSNTGMFTQLISDARAAEYELVEPRDEERLFYKLPWWKKVIVMSGGPMVNLVLAFLLFSAVFMLHGVPTATTTVSEVADCVIAYDPDQAEEPTCSAADAASPAKQAGLEVGDRIISFNGTEISSWDQLTTVIRANRDGEATIVIERDGERLTTTTNTTVNPRPESADNPERVVKVGFLGVVPDQVLVKQGPVYVVTTMGDYTWETVKAHRLDAGQALLRRPGGARPGGARRRLPDERRRGQPRRGGGGLQRHHPRVRPVLRAARPARRAQPVPRHVQLRAAAPARRRPHRRRPLRGGPPRPRPAASAARTPATSTSPSSCRSPT